MSNIQIGDLSSEIEKMLKDYTADVTEVVQEAIPKVANKAVKDLKKNSPKKSGKYSKSWKKKIEKSRIGSNCVIYNEKYYLTHLLENGHANRDGGRTPAKPHIAPVNESIQKDFEEEIEKGIAKLS